MKRNQQTRSLVTAALALAFLCLTSASARAANPSLIISEFRLRGPNGANDEFVEIYNNSDEDHLVASGGGSLGYALVASDGVKRFVIPNGTVIPARGHYLGVNSVGYSLASYPAGHGTTAVGDAAYTLDIPDNMGLALFKTSKVAYFTLANRLDAVGPTTEANALYREGAGYPALTPFSVDYSFYRDTRYGHPRDTGDNAADFFFVDTNGTSAGAGQHLGTPGPENLSSPRRLGGADAISRTDTTKCPNCSPNRVRDHTSDPADNSTFGTLAFRRRFVNPSGGPITRLRLRVVDLMTFPAPSGYADLRPRTSPAATVSTVAGAVTVRGTTLEEPPSQPNGGGFNSTLTVDGVTLATPLAAGASLHFQILLGLQDTGNYHLALAVETEPATGSAVYLISGNTEAGGNSAPVVDLNGDPLGFDNAANFSEGDAPVKITEPFPYSLTDADSPNLKSLRARLTNRPDGAMEFLAADTAGTNISASYEATSGVLSLDGPDSIANFRKVLESVRYGNASPEPNMTPRVVEFTANDGDSNSAVARSTVNMKGKNDAPVNTVPGLVTTNVNVPVFLVAASNSAFEINDADAGSLPVRVKLTATHGSLTLTGTSGLNFTVGDGAFDQTMTFQGSLSAVNIHLSELFFKPAQDYTGPASIEVLVNDLGNTGEGGAKTDTDTISVNVVKAGVLQFGAATYAPGPEGSAVTVTVKRTNGSNGTVKVNYATMNESAVAGQDYTAKTGTLTFLQGEMNKTFTVATTDDTKVEAGETFKVKLSSPTNGATVGALDTAVVTIEDNDVPGASVNDVTLTEGNSGTRNAVFTVTLDEAPVAAAVTVNFTTQNQSAAAGSDYVALNGQLTFGTGQKSKTVTVQVKGDAADESDETFLLKLGSPVGLTIVDGQGSGKIVDDDAGAGAAAREAASVQFANPAYSTAEGAKSVTIEVTREGDVSKAASVRYSSDGLGSLVGCDVVGGVATPRCDYSTDLGVLRFAPGERTRSFTVAIIDDSYADGMETTQLRLSDAVGVELGAQAQAQLTIEDNDAEGPGSASPVESPEGFVRQQYLDLLGREPEPEGERYWVGQMDECRGCGRAEVSARFFRSREFEGRGYFVYRFYEAGLGRLPSLAEFMPDAAGMSGRLSEAELEASRREFVESFASRPEFEDRYGALTDPAAYVDALLQTAGLPNHPGRDAWVEALANRTATRPGVLRALVESAEVYEKFYDRGFVAMQYFGHLRRDPDGSYLHWLDVMNETKGDTRAVIEGFLKSPEYRARFGKQ